MPALAGDALGVGVRVDREDLGVALRARRIRMDVQFAEQPAERLVLIEGQLLVAKEYHLMRHQRVVHFLELLVAERPAEIDTGNFRADRRGGRLHLDGLVRHRTTPWQHLRELSAATGRQANSSYTILRSHHTCRASTSRRSDMAIK